MNKQRRLAEREALRDKVSALVDRQQTLFVRDHPDQATKEQTLFFLEHVEDVLDDSIESDAVKASLTSLKRDFHLDDNLGEPVPDFDKFKTRLTSLKDAFIIDQADTS